MVKGKFHGRGAPGWGGIDLPLQDELFCATRGGGAWLDGKRLQVSAASELKRPLLAIGSPTTSMRSPSRSSPPGGRS